MQRHRHTAKFFAISFRRSGCKKLAFAVPLERLCLKGVYLGVLLILSNVKANIHAGCSQSSVRRPPRNEKPLQV